jgi:hypothetical protein
MTPGVVRKHSRQSAATAAAPTPLSLAPAIDDYALACFYSIHLVHPASTSNERCSLIQDSALLAAMKALGCAAQATIYRNQALSCDAQEFYVQAIKATSSALSQNTATSDTTLLAIITLSYYESTVGRDTESSDAWLNHVQGTSALLSLRGLEQIQTSDGRLLFMQAATNLMSLFTRLKKRLPPHIYELGQKAYENADRPHDMVWQVTLTWMKVVDFYSDVMDRRIPDAQKIISQALRLDADFISSFVNPSEAWLPRRVSVLQQHAKLLDPLQDVLLHSSTLVGQVSVSMSFGRLILQYAS